MNYAANLVDPMLHGQHLTHEKELEDVKGIVKTAQNNDDVDEETVLAMFAQYKVKEGINGSKLFLLSTKNKIRVSASVR